MLKTVTPVLALTIAFGLVARTAPAQDLEPGSGRRTCLRPARWALTTSVLTDTASVYAIAEGGLTLHSTVATAGAPRSIAVHPNGRFAYLASGGTGSLQAFRFDRATGTLTARASVPLPGGSPDPEIVAVEPLGRFLYATDRRASTLAGFWIHPLTGALFPLPGFPLATGAGPTDIVFDQDGRHAFVSNVVAATISVYGIGLTGRLTPVDGSPFATAPARPRGLAIDPKGRFLYATRGLDTGALAFGIDRSGGLTPVPGSPFPGGADTIGAATSTAGRTLYISDPALELVLMRRIDADTGALSDLTPPRVVAGNNVYQIQADRSGRFLYVAASFPGAIFAYAIDAAGVLTPVAGSPFIDESGIGSLALIR